MLKASVIIYEKVFVTDPLFEQSTIFKLKSGQTAAFDQVFKILERPIFNHVYRLTGSKEDAADLTQETFLKIYQKRSAINPSQNFKAWVYKIATNTVYDWFDKNKRTKFNISIDETGVETIDDQTPYYRIDKAEIMDLETAMAKIKPEYQTVILLHYQQGFGYEEIADILKIPLGTVKTLLYRAKKALAIELKV